MIINGSRSSNSNDDDDNNNVTCLSVMMMSQKHETFFVSGLCPCFHCIIQPLTFHFQFTLENLRWENKVNDKFSEYTASKGKKREDKERRHPRRTPHSHSHCAALSAKVFEVKSKNNNTRQDSLGCSSAPLKIDFSSLPLFFEENINELSLVR
jgi:hypothetical protein